jgi:type III pantothenate kinase
LGTAITVDLVEADGAFAGGAILPGIGMAGRALADQTDALPFRGDTSLALASALLADGDPDSAAAAARKAARLYADKGSRVAAARAEQFLSGAAGPV